MIDPTDQARDRLAASFGYQEVPPEDKPALVRDLFARVAWRYDLMNDLMSAGVHRLWKAAMIDWLAPRPGLRLLDVAGGTGDIAFRVLAGSSKSGQRAQDRRVRRQSAPCSRSAAIGRSMPNRLDAIEWVCADAEALPLPDRSVDAYTIAFGIRNVTRIDRALAEARRVLGPGGRFLCLEFTPAACAGAASRLRRLLLQRGAVARRSASPATRRPTAIWSRASGAFPTRRPSRA